MRPWTRLAKCAAAAAVTLTGTGLAVIVNGDKSNSGTVSVADVLRGCLPVKALAMAPNSDVGFDHVALKSRGVVAVMLQGSIARPKIHIHFPVSHSQSFVSAAEVVHHEPPQSLGQFDPFAVHNLTPGHESFTHLPAGKHVNGLKWDSNWDSRQPETMISPRKLEKMSSKERGEALEKLTPKSTRHLILIRHGQYFIDSEEKNLTSLGREQASLTGIRLVSTGIKFGKLVHSTMTRAAETADLVMAELSQAKHTADFAISADAMLEEGAPYPPEPPLSHWRPARKEFLTDGTRIEAAYRKYFHRAEPDQSSDSHEILVCHGNVIRYFVCRALQFPPEGWLRLSLANCSVTWIMIRPSGRVVVKSFGDSGHLPANLVTYS